MDGEDADPGDDSPLFGSFTSYTPQFHKHYSSSHLLSNSSDEKLNVTKNNTSQNFKQLITPELRKLNVKQRIKLYFIQIENIYIFFFQISSRPLKFPSTPDAEYFPELLSTPDREEIKTIHQYLKQQSQQHLQQNQKTLSSLEIKGDKLSVNSVKNSLDQTKVITALPPQSVNRQHISTPESSQTDSDDVSPQIQRKRKTISHKDMLPKFSISIEDTQSE